MLCIGIDIGGTKCAVTIGNENGEILWKRAIATTNATETLEQIYVLAKEAAGTAQAEYHTSPAAVGISCGGPLDSRRGLIQSPPNLPGWDNIPITAALTDLLHIPAYLQNDANACAMAEWKYGAGRGCENMIFCTFGTGMGAGLILNGRLYAGTTDNAGEIGHMRMTETGPVGYGKAGSFEGYCSGGGIAQLGKTYAMEAFQRGKTVSYCASPADMEQISAKSIAIAAREGHADAIAVYDRCADKLGAGLAILADILNPERIVLGSIFMRDRALLADRMDAVLRRECLPGVYNALQVVPAELSENIGDVAAITVAAEGLRLSNRAE
ncbi:MAG: ROK family protein [Eubacteriales bacterium]|nr:ROK family protein [Eubacteriales bacterium]